MTKFIPTEQELKELEFIQDIDTGIYEYRATNKTSIFFDYNIEQENKFYAVEGKEEHLLEFENKEEYLFFITKLKEINEKTS